MHIILYTVETPSLQIYSHAFVSNFRFHTCSYWYMYMYMVTSVYLSMLSRIATVA